MSDSEQPKRSTRDALIYTALELFAREGIDGVTLRRISAESGSANTAAVHYYFKNKLGLLMAIIDLLEQLVWIPGATRLKQEVDQGAPIRTLLNAGLWPYKRTVFDFPWGADAQAFSFHVCHCADERPGEAFAKVRHHHYNMFRDALRHALPDLSLDVFDQRWEFLMTEAIAGQWVRTRVFGLGDPSAWTPEQERSYLERYLDYAVGGLSAESTASG